MRFGLLLLCCIATTRNARISLSKRLLDVFNVRVCTARYALESMFTSCSIV